tara:strand:+ start:2924 stop:4612 length:1689 start_codon:yes stop_codon:yes gene_type:complete
MNIVYFLGAFYLILLSVLGYGFLFLKIFTNSENYPTNHDIYLKYVGFLGLSFLTFISYITHLFINHGYFHNITLHSIGFIFGIIFLINNKKFIKYIIIISFFVICSLFISKGNEDLPYYHLPYTIYLIEHKIIFGMGHLNHGFNLLSSIFYLNSIFYLPYINLYSFHFSQLYFLIFFSFFLFNEVFKNKDNKNFIKFLYTFAFMFFVLSFNRIAEYGTDKVGQLLVVILVMHLFNTLYEKKQIAKVEIAIIFSLFIYLFTLKTYFLTYSLLIVPILILQKDKLVFLKNITYSKIFLYSFTFLCLLIITNIVATGCLISPIKQLCFGPDNLLWARKIESIGSLNLWVEQWAKAGAGPNFRHNNPSQYIQYFNWVGGWVDRYFFNKFTDTIGIFFIVLLVLFFSTYKLENINIIKRYDKHFYFIFAIFLIFFVWFFKHPTLRYGGYSIFFLVLSIPISLVVEKLKIKINFIKKLKYMIIITLLVFNFKNLSRIYDEFQRDDMFKYTNFPNYAIQYNKFDTIKTESGLDLYQPTNGACWVTPAPCYRGNDLTFYKINNYYFIKGK